MNRGSGGTHQAAIAVEAGGALHEGHAGFPTVWLFSADRRGLAGLRGGVCARQHLRGSGAARSAQGVFELAYLPAALRQWRAGRRLRYRARDVSQRGAEAAPAGRRRRTRRLISAHSVGVASNGGAPSIWLRSILSAARRRAVMS